MRQPTRFLALFDVHWGFERRSGHKVPLHDEKAVQIALKFASDFRPDVVILGGDILDCNAISHHERNKPGAKEGLRLIEDAEECAERLIKPLKQLGANQYHYLIGNHELWLDDLEQEVPGLRGLLNIRRILNLPKSWNVIEQGGSLNLGKLTFIHGDALSGGEHVAKSAVTTYERSIRFGHHHSHQVFTKCSPLDNKFGKSGVLVPCLCKKNPGYLKGKANRWVQGLLSGYVMLDGTYNDHVSIITNGRMISPAGKVYTP